MPIIGNPTLLTLNVRNTASSRSNGSPCQFADNTFHQMLRLFQNREVVCQVFSPTNVCFVVTEEMIDQAYAEMDKDTLPSVTESDLVVLKEKFCTPNEYGNTLLMMLPNLYIEETPKEIEELTEELNRFLAEMEDL